MGDKYRTPARCVSYVALVALLVSALVGCISQNPIIQVTATDGEASQALQKALTQLGKPYRLGGQSPTEGFDCSGLIVWAYQQAIPNAYFKVGNETVVDASIADLYRWNVNLTLPEDLIPGDIVFLSDEAGQIVHGGFFIERLNGDMFRFISASSHFGRVVLDEWPLEGEKRGQRFAGGGRLKVVRQ